MQIHPQIRHLYTKNRNSQKATRGREVVSDPWSLTSCKRCSGSFFSPSTCEEQHISSYSLLLTAPGPDGETQLYKMHLLYAVCHCLVAAEWAKNTVLLFTVSATYLMVLSFSFMYLNSILKTSLRMWEQKKDHVSQWEKKRTVTPTGFQSQSHCYFAWSWTSLKLFNIALSTRLALSNCRCAISCYYHFSNKCSNEAHHVSPCHQVIGESFSYKQILDVACPHQFFTHIILLAARNWELHPIWQNQLSLPSSTYEEM